MGSFDRGKRVFSGDCTRPAVGVENCYPECSLTQSRLYESGSPVAADSSTNVGAISGIEAGTSANPREAGFPNTAPLTDYKIKFYRESESAVSSP